MTMAELRRRRERAAYLALADGTVFRGWSFGAPRDQLGEAVFNTGMTGYQEIVSDPSYAGQFVTLTAPEIGNYGCCFEDRESRGLFLHGLVVHRLNEPSNFRSEQSLSELLRTAGVPGLAGVDTRSLTLHLREHGTQKAYLHVEDTPLEPAEAIRRAAAWEGLDGQDYASRVSVTEPYTWNSSGSFQVVVIDFGVKYNILRQLAAADCRVTVVPARTPVGELLARKPDGILLSNGPADPAAVTYAVDHIRELLGRVPLFGICLGHQLLGLAAGARTVRLKFGHHGCNHPVRDLRTGAVEITSQNHNFALAADSLPEQLEVTHVNLNDGTVEGIRFRDGSAFSVQYHPEAAPGPHDGSGLFEEFKQRMREGRP